MADPSTYKYNTNHQWVDLDGTKARMGVTDYLANGILNNATEAGGMPDKGSTIKQGDTLVDVTVDGHTTPDYTFSSPIDGNESDRNEHLLDKPGLLNSDPYGQGSNPDNQGWIAQVTATDPSQIAGMMSQADYQEYLRSLPG